MIFLTNTQPNKVDVFKKLAALPSINIPIYVMQAEPGLDGKSLPDMVGLYTDDTMTKSQNIRFFNAYLMFCQGLKERGTDIEEFCARKKIE